MATPQIQCETASGAARFYSVASFYLIKLNYAPDFYRGGGADPDGVILHRELKNVTEVTLPPSSIVVLHGSIASQSGQDHR